MRMSENRNTLRLNGQKWLFGNRTTQGPQDMRNSVWLVSGVDTDRHSFPILFRISHEGFEYRARCLQHRPKVQF